MKLKSSRTAGILLLLAGLFLGMYVGGYQMFYGGIAQIIDGLKNDLNAASIAWGILRIVFAGFAGVLSWSVLVFPGLLMIEYEKIK